MLLLILFFNWGIMFYIVTFTLRAAHLFRHTTDQVFLSITAALSFVIVISLAFLLTSAAGQWLLRLLSGARKTIPREDAKLNPIIARVQEAIKVKMGLAPLPIRVMILDSRAPNASAIGKHTIIISRALYEKVSEDELAGIIAHEFGHLHNGDSNKLGIALGLSLVSLTLASVTIVITAIIETCFAIGSKTGGEPIGLLGLVALPFYFLLLFLMIFIYAGNGMLKLAALFVGRKQEYKADQFAIKAGFGIGLLSFLDKVKNVQFDAPQKLFEKLYASHPPIMLRIGKIETLSHDNSPSST